METPVYPSSGGSASDLALPLLGAGLSLQARWPFWVARDPQVHLLPKVNAILGSVIDPLRKELFQRLRFLIPGEGEDAYQGQTHYFSYPSSKESATVSWLSPSGWVDAPVAATLQELRDAIGPICFFTESGALFKNLNAVFTTVTGSPSGSGFIFSGGYYSSNRLDMPARRWAFREKPFYQSDSLTSSGSLYALSYSPGSAIHSIRLFYPSSTGEFTAKPVQLKTARDDQAALLGFRRLPREIESSLTSRVISHRLLQTYGSRHPFSHPVNTVSIGLKFNLTRHNYWQGNQSLVLSSLPSQTVWVPQSSPIRWGETPLSPVPSGSLSLAFPGRDVYSLPVVPVAAHYVIGGSRTLPDRASGYFSSFTTADAYSAAASIAAQIVWKPWQVVSGTLTGVLPTGDYDALCVDKMAITSGLSLKDRVYADIYEAARAHLKFKGYGDMAWTGKLPLKPNLAARSGAGKSVD